MECSRSSIFRLFAAAGLVLLLILPALVEADGGPILSDPELWAMIDEGQQIAVVQLRQDGTAQVDLFISLTDRSGQSHEVTFFLPLGVGAADLSVVEETSYAFDDALTTYAIDRKLEAERQRKDWFREGVQVALLVGTLTTHGAWFSPPGLIALIGWGIGAPPPPLATFETPSSQVSVYDINSETDLQALIETTGLDPKVKETLLALQGQQIAVIKLQTQPVSAEEGSTDRWESTGQPGIHLGWRSTLVPHSAGATYSYPLGTGQAWANPIELTRVYMISPPELDFTVDYPQLGDDLSGLAETRADEILRAIDDTGRPAFAVDEAYGDWGHIWRATYVMSNSAQDVVVTSLPGPGRQVERAIRRARVQEVIDGLSWYIAPLAGLIVWVMSWRVVMRRRLGVPYGWHQWRLYRDALLWVVLYPITILVALLPAGLMSLLGDLLRERRYRTWQDYRTWQERVQVVVILLAILAALGLVDAFLYARWKAHGLQVTRGRAFGAYMLAVLMANVLYVAFAVVYYAVVSAI
jgi:hypothetical protein